VSPPTCLNNVPQGVALATVGEIGIPRYGGTPSGHLGLLESLFHQASPHAFRPAGVAPRPHTTTETRARREARTQETKKRISRRKSKRRAASSKLVDSETHYVQTERLRKYYLGKLEIMNGVNVLGTHLFFTKLSVSRCFVFRRRTVPAAGREMVEKQCRKATKLRTSTEKRAPVLTRRACARKNSQGACDKESQGACEEELAAPRLAADLRFARSLCDRSRRWRLEPRATTAGACLAPPRT
jgi:hypothetical protein